MTIIAKCKHNEEVYCNNWDGKGNGSNFAKADVFDGECPKDTKNCPHIRTPKPAPKLRGQ